jgi:hypothetical protein
MVAYSRPASQNQIMDSESKDLRLPLMIGKDKAAPECWHLADGISTKAAAVYRLIGTIPEAKPLLSDMYVWLGGSGVTSEELTKALERLKKSRQT